jgi:diguanylate cyclase (GGDEF)-like protein/PAS domain S-box-containing protein
MLTLAVVLFGTTAIAMLFMANQVDESSIRAESARAEGAISQRLSALEGQAADWSMWDDSYRFVGGTDPDYIRTNLPDETFTNLGVNLVAFYDTTGRPTFVRGFDLRSSEPTAIPAASDLLSGQPALNLVASPKQSFSGVYRLPTGEIMMLGAGEVLPSSREGQPLGTLVMGRFLDDDEIAAISDQTQLELALEPGAASSTRDDAILSDGRITMLIPLTDRSGTPIAALRVSKARRAYEYATRAIIHLALAVFGLVGATAMLIYSGMRHGVLKRLVGLQQAVRRIRVTGTPERLDLPGDDELSALALDVEDLVYELDDAKSKVEAARDELDLQVAELNRTVAQLTDQSERRAAAEAGRALSEERFAALIANLSDVVFTMDPKGRLDFVSAAAAELLGADPASVTGEDVSALVGPVGADLITRRVRRGITDEGARLSFETHAAEGRTLDLEVVLTPLPDRPGHQGILRDVTAQRRHENELLHMASHDFLTGLWNRRRFETELERMLAEAARTGDSGAVFWLDLDGFKDVNDTLGHKAGDELLVRFARRLTESLRADSVVARLGGDEFAVVLPDCDMDAGRAAAERLVDEIGRMRFDIEGQVVRISASLGLVHYPDHGTVLEDLLARADVAMYEAKELGQAHVVSFNPDSQWKDAIEDRRVWTEMVELALNEGGLVAYAQPITDMHTGQVVSYELLVRMLDFSGSIIPPARFLPIAERTGMIVDIDMWMLGQAVELLTECPNDIFRINVNAPARTLGDPRFLDELTRLVTEFDFDSSRLAIEITETTIIVDVAGVSDTLRRIKDLGCRVALDDFGSGFTSFLHLKQLPVDDIKIDGSFVRNVEGNPNDQHLVRAMVEMAKGLDMRTTAEFVETQANLELLRSFGVEMAQGYLIGEPRPLEETVRAAADRRSA